MGARRKTHFLSYRFEILVKVLVGWFFLFPPFGHVWIWRCDVSSRLLFRRLRAEFSGFRRFCLLFRLVNGFWLAISRVFPGFIERISQIRNKYPVNLARVWRKRISRDWASSHLLSLTPTPHTHTPFILDRSWAESWPEGTEGIREDGGENST